MDARKEGLLQNARFSAQVRALECGRGAGSWLLRGWAVWGCCAVLGPLVGVGWTPPDLSLGQLGSDLQGRGADWDPKVRWLLNPHRRG